MTQSGTYAGCGQVANTRRCMDWADRASEHRMGICAPHSLAAGEGSGNFGHSSEFITQLGLSTINRWVDGVT